MSKRRALFGGSFDPPHFGHQFVIQYLLESELVDEVRVAGAQLDHGQPHIYQRGSFAPTDVSKGVLAKSSGISRQLHLYFGIHNASWF